MEVSAIHVPVRRVRGRVPAEKRHLRRVRESATASRRSSGAATRTAAAWARRTSPSPPSAPTSALGTADAILGAPGLERCAARSRGAAASIEGDGAHVAHRQGSASHALLFFAFACLFARARDFDPAWPETPRRTVASVVLIAASTPPTTLAFARDETPKARGGGCRPCGAPPRARVRGDGARRRRRRVQRRLPRRRARGEPGISTGTAGGTTRSRRLEDVRAMSGAPNRTARC